MLQRSPSYIVSLPGEDPIAKVCCAACCRRALAYPIVRWKNVLLTMLSLPAQPAPAGTGQGA